MVRTGRPPKTELTKDELARLREVASRRVNGESWAKIAADMGWRNRQTAHQWYARAHRVFMLKSAETNHRLRVRSEVTRAKQAGLLVPKPCAVCGTTEKVQAHHHNGYDGDPLDVQWLCFVHHRKAHGQLKNVVA